MQRKFHVKTFRHNISHCATEKQKIRTSSTEKSLTNSNFPSNHHHQPVSLTQNIIIHQRSLSYVYNENTTGDLVVR